ncbi:MAG TPA: AmmeMemoRadiSam system protein B [Phycisphaerae bacterium]|nr:AmmeMemoRadiSam system protein B [Phycisphaerae bacterium]
MMIREPIVAGRFYPGSGQACRADLEQRIPGEPDLSEVPEYPIGAIVPHAGWMCSGEVAGRVFAVIAKRRSPSTFVLFGAAHMAAAHQAAIFSEGAWDTPLGRVEVDQRLAERICSQTNLIQPDAYAHENEHSIEVQVPFVQHLFPDARIVPIVVPPSPAAHEVGQAVARTVAGYAADVFLVGSTDLTHYGPQYHFTPEGTGPEGVRWAKQVNDKRLIDLMTAMESERIVPEAAAHQNACGAGAIAATIAACKQLGADEAVVLEHTTSSEVLGGQGAGFMADSVGYVGMVFGRSAP